MPQRVRWMFGVVALWVGAITVAGQAQQTPPVIKKVPPPYVTPASGAAMFHEYCSACHGVSGKGDGPAAPALNPKPADLTTFAKRRDGQFSRKEFEDKLNGLLMAKGHGNSAMPVWGPIFKQLGADELRKINLAGYVESLQVK